MRRLAALAVLVLAWLGLERVGLEGGSPPGGLLTVVSALGLLAAVAFAEVVAAFGLPRVTGYLAAGIALGPASGLVGPDVIWRLAPIESAALGLLAFQAGFSVDLRRVRQLGRATFGLAFAHTLVVPAVTFGAALLAAPLVPGVLAAPGAWESLALVVAALALAPSPVVVAAVVADTEARGRLTDLVHATTLLLLFTSAGVLAAALASAAPEAASRPAVSEIGLSLLAAAGAAVATAVLALVAARALGERAAFGLLVLAAAAAPAVLDAGAEPTLAFALAGAIARTASGRSGVSLARGLDTLVLPAAAVYFGFAGADLVAPPDLLLVLGAAVVVLGRAGGLWLATLAGRRLGGETEARGRWAWMAFLPQGGTALGLAAVAAHALPDLAPGLTALAAAVVAGNLLLGPIALKAALHGHAELRSDVDSAAVPPAVEAPVTAADLASEEAPVDPLAALAGPGDPESLRPWRATAAGLVALRDRLDREVVGLRLEEAAALLRVTSGQARHAVQAASEACGRAESEGEMIEALRHHRRYLASHVREELGDRLPPARAEGIPPCLHALSEGVEQLVREAPAEVHVRESALHLLRADGDPLRARVFKAAKRWIRAAESLVGIPAPERDIPYRRMVRRVVGGEMVTRLAPLETLVGRAELKALRRVENLLRRADDVFVGAAALVLEGASPEQVREWLQERLGELRESSQEAGEDVGRLRSEPSRRFAEEAARALADLRDLAERAVTLPIREASLRYASVAPRLREAVQRAEEERRAWAAREEAVLARIGLAVELVDLKDRLRSLAFESALAPVQRMHGRISGLLQTARDRVQATRGVVLAMAEVGRDPDRGEYEISKLQDELSRRMDRPIEGIVHTLRSGAVVDRLLQALEHVTDTLPRQVLLLGEAELLALERGLESDALPRPVPVRELTRAFFDRNVAVRLAEHVRALETSAEEALAGIHDAMRLLAIPIGRAGEEGAGRPAAGAGEGLVPVLDQAAERLDHQIAQTREASAALLREVDSTRAKAVVELWARLQEVAGRTEVEAPMGGLRRRLEGVVPALLASPRVVRIRERWSDLVSRLVATRRAVEARADVTLGGPERIRRDLARIRTDRRDLPYVYGKLFSLEPTENEAFIVGRAEETGWIRERLKGGGGGAIVVVGERGSGRTSVVRVALARGKGERPVVWLEADRPFASPIQLRKWVARAMGFTGPVVDPEVVAAEVRQRAPIVVVDGLERCLERSARGLVAAEALARMIAATRGQVLWIATAERSSWDLLGEVTRTGDLFDTVIRLKPLSPESLRSAVERRHRLAGMDLGWRRGRIGGPRELFERMRRIPPDEQYFRRLAHVSRGNPRAALQLWVLSIRPIEERTLEVSPCPSAALESLSELSGHLLVALRLALVHGVLDLDHLRRAAGWDEVEARAALTSLVASGLLESRPRSDGELTFRVPPWAEASSIRHLWREGLHPARRDVG